MRSGKEAPPLPAALAAAGVGGCRRTGGHSYELHGVCEGSPQVLFRSTDRRTFSQVVHALVRAMGYADDHLTN
ncbi:hypothetical protein CS0771_76480 [Catellatospora sp. IY07-71]|uniref:DUF6232 family protein n=1 Tax=Catellatospora sp. IY07-71 TaxID=2728827 RepID=UPI001BB447F1|nr:DUF6232 family protein [Catellatospora sp. IY07-71]BCJ78104.1 hypothetical protein CS0771_76480 [Catellatospora sp. IY07-71]